MSHNKLVSVPASLGELSDLLHLHLSHNELKALPEGVGRLQGQHLRWEGEGQGSAALKNAWALCVLSVR